jgi:hypothetical protein
MGAIERPKTVVRAFHCVPDRTLVQQDELPAR